MIKYFIPIFGVASIFISGCLKKEELTNPQLPIYRPDVAVPLVYSDLTLDDLITDEGMIEGAYLGTDPDGLYYIKFEEVLTSKTANTVVVIKDQEINEPNLPLMNQSLSYFFDFTKDKDNDKISMGNLSKVILKQGDLFLDVQNPTNAHFTITLTFPEITNNSGQALSIIKNSGGASSFQAFVDFSDYIITFPNYPNTNNLNYNMGISNYTGSTSQKISLNFGIKNINYKRLEGTFNDIEIDELNGETEVQVFKDILDGNLYFADPQVTFNFKNSYGVRIDPNKQYFTTTGFNGVNKSMDAGDLEKGVKIIEAAPSPGTYAETPFYINNTNSTDDPGQNVESLKSALYRGAHYLTYSVKPILKAGTGFIEDNSEMTVLGQVKLPFHGRVNHYKLQDTSDVNLDNADELEYADFSIFTTNKIPVKLKLQIYFADDAELVNGNWKIIDSLFVGEQIILAAPKVDPNGIVIEGAFNKTTVRVDSERLIKLAEANKLLITMTFQTADNTTTDVKFFKTNNVQLQLSVHAKGKIDLNQ